MTSRAQIRPNRTRQRRKHSRSRLRFARFWPSARSRRRVSHALRRAPALLKVLGALVVIVLLWFPVNWLYQVIHKPTELLFPVSGTLNKKAPETWREYGPLFERYSTKLITPELLAALAQVEGAGNPAAQTYWRWSWRASPFEVYRPASSAVGMYQLTNGTFDEAKRYCIRQHAVKQDCWSNGLYSRVMPSNAVELTAAYLDRRVAGALAQRRSRSVSREQTQELAAVIHLCGAGAGDIFVRRGMRLTDGQRCGAHTAADYVARVTAARRVFEALRGRAVRALTAIATARVRRSTATMPSADEAPGGENSRDRHS